MKGGFHGLKGKQISLITIVLMSTTILMWAWEKTPLLTTLVPSETRLQVSPGLSPVVFFSPLWTEFIDFLSVSYSKNTLICYTICLFTVCICFMFGAELRDVPVVSSVSSEQELHVGNGVGTLAQKDAPKEEVRLGVASPLDSGQDSSKSDEINSDQVTNPDGTTMPFSFVFLGLVH